MKAIFNDKDAFTITRAQESFIFEQQKSYLNLFFEYNQKNYNDIKQYIDTKKIEKITLMNNEDIEIYSTTNLIYFCFLNIDFNNNPMAMQISFSNTEPKKDAEE